MKKILLITILIGSALFLTACSISVDKKTGCERYTDLYKEDCNWCEDNGGKYMNRGFSGVECVFLPLSNRD
jgi:hypothetical protein